MVPDWAALELSLNAAGLEASSTAPRPVGGGDIAAAYQLDTASGKVFLKLMPEPEAGVLEAEADGLAAIAAPDTVRTPAVLGSGVAGNDAWLALEWLSLDRLGSAAGAELGRQLANMHRATHDQHGWDRDNWIGRTPQRNTRQRDWVEFYREHRLGFQLDLAAASGFGGRLQRRGKELMATLPAFFSDYQPAPSLLHGDLWGGNAASANAVPVIFDPAIHYGDRESDIAMTRLFGGFGRPFYQAYEETWPLDAGYSRREPLYQLYHVLNHLNLFGSGYLGRAESLIAELLRNV
jgi:fructosamine-3-kinase